MKKLENLLEFDTFIESELFDETLTLIAESKTKEEYLTEVFSSEYFDLNELNERTVYEEEIYREYRRIRPQLVKGYRSKKLTAKYFKLEQENMTRNLEKDRSHVKLITEEFVEKLQSLNEDDFDVTLNVIRKEKIEEIKSFRRKTLRKITGEIKEMEEFYSSNPQLLVI